MNTETVTQTITTDRYGVLTLSTHPEDSRYLCWRNVLGERVSRYYGDEAEALYYAPR